MPKGNWRDRFDATEWGGPFTEGSSWHWTWSVFHDPEGLSELMGGHEPMVARLDSMFVAPNTYNYGTYGFVIHEIAEMVALNMGQYAHGNQPVQHAIYLYDYIGQPWKHSTISVMLWINSTIPEVKDTVATRTTGRHLLGMYFLLWVSIRFVRECLNMR